MPTKELDSGPSVQVAADGGERVSGSRQPPPSHPSSNSKGTPPGSQRRDLSGGGALGALLHVLAQGLHDLGGVVVWLVEDDVGTPAEDAGVSGERAGDEVKAARIAVGF
jgi:hypothetical protein